jgi:hypothetical protein
MCSWDSECSVKSDGLSYADPYAARSRQVPKSLRERVYTGVQGLFGARLRLRGTNGRTNIPPSTAKHSPAPPSTKPRKFERGPSAVHLHFKYG